MLSDLDSSEFDLEWYAGGTLLAKVKTTATSDGFIFICEACGHKPWAAKYFPNRALTKFFSACRAHPSSRGEVPGSMILWFHDEMSVMPDALIRREYEVHLAYYLKEISNEAQSGDTRSTEVPRGLTERLPRELAGGDRGQDRLSPNESR